MTAIKKLPFQEGMSYKEAAAKFRAEYVAKAKPIEGEILPINGKIHVVLSGAISAERLYELLGQSEIDIPEFRQPIKKLNSVSS